MVMRQALAGMLWTKQHYYFDLDIVAARALRAPAALADEVRRPQPAVGAHGQRRRHLDAGQVGVPLVRGVGPRVPHGAAGDGRP